MLDPGVPASQSRREPFSWVAVIALTFFLLSSILGKMMLHMGGGSAAYFAACGLGVIVFLLAYFLNNNRRPINRMPRYIVWIALIIVGLCLLSAVSVFTSNEFDRSTRYGGLYKAAGVIPIILIALLGSRVFTPRELIFSLLIFAVIEGLLVMASFRLGLDFNNNALSVRMTGAAMILYTVSRSRYLGWAAIAIAIGLSFMLQCRTTAVGLVGAVALFTFETRTQKQRGLSVIFAATAVALLMVFSADIWDGIKQIALSSLGSDHALAEFFLSDKNASKIRSDLFDRKYVWEASLQRINERPLFGHGIGSESDLLGARSHNAYLSLLFEGGIVYFLAWMSIYLLFMRRVLDYGFVRTFGKSRIYKCATILFAYLMLAGIAESSGIGSVSTPINVVFLMMFSYMLAVERRFSPRQPYSVYEELSMKRKTHVKARRPVPREIRQGPLVPHR